ncbi:MAG: sialate O-acetylesterase, partial [Phycisphaerales bacterium]
MVNPARALAPFAVVSAVPFILCAAATADLKLDPLFSPHAVLQRMRPIPVEGRPEPGARVEVELGGADGAKASGTAGSDGRFSVVLPAMPASREPATLVVRSGRDEVAVGDILVGDVWFCSGQSNMEWPIDAA